MKTTEYAIIQTTLNGEPFVRRISEHGCAFAARQQLMRLRLAYPDDDYRMQREVYDLDTHVETRVIG